MESKNPDAMAVDTRSMAEKMKDDGNEPNPVPNDQVTEKSAIAESEDKSEQSASDITEDEAKEMANSCPRIDQMITELGAYNVRSVDDIKRIEEIINRYELYRKYGE